MAWPLDSCRAVSPIVFRCVTQVGSAATGTVVKVGHDVTAASKQDALKHTDEVITGVQEIHSCEFSL